MSDTYIIEKLIDIRENKKKTKPEHKIELLIKWQGWDSRYNNWEPLGNYQDDEDDKSILCGTDVTNLLVL